NDNYISIDGVLYDKGKKTLIQCPGGKTSIEIPNSVTSIGKGAFKGCEALTSIEIPNSVTSIESEAFGGCTALTSIHIRCEHPENLEIHKYAFYGTNIENCTLYVPIGTGYAYRHHPVFSKFKEVIIEK
ncbi:MAG: leucine-rich repeat domain-containing protein, partial [Paludibacteraceae bacterium]|nr:leucine-rich repeat domain-containing protein [Paludibacteraceae bacterium]